MIRALDIEKRVFNAINDLIGDQYALFNLPASGQGIIFQKQSDAPRPDSPTLIFCQVRYPRTLSNLASGDSRTLNKTTRKETISIHRIVEVVISIVSKTHTYAKDAMEFLILACNSQARRDKAFYGPGYDFDLPIYNINKDIKDLTELECGAWAERVETEFTFQINDEIELAEVQPVITDQDKINIKITEVL